MIVSVTGTSSGSSQFQLERLGQMIRWIKYDMEIGVHGDCIGADTDFHNLCLAEKIPIHIHPCNHPSRAWNKGAVFIAPVKKPLVRNVDMVDKAALTIGIPRLEFEEQRSGTWHSIRYAKKIGRKLAIIWPSGRIENFG